MKKSDKKDVEKKVNEVWDAAVSKKPSDLIKECVQDSVSAKGVRVGDIDFAEIAEGLESLKGTEIGEKADAYAEGYIKGHAEGYNEGYQKGFFVGIDLYAGDIEEDDPEDEEEDKEEDEDIEEYREVEKDCEEELEEEIEEIGEEEAIARIEALKKEFKKIAKNYDGIDIEVEEDEEEDGVRSVSIKVTGDADKKLSDKDTAKLIAECDEVVDRIWDGKNLTSEKETSRKDKEKKYDPDGTEDKNGYKKNYDIADDDEKYDVDDLLEAIFEVLFGE